ncbi:3D-(3,5/4)-trihydroxycyclohexane-1,2-dione acylhydrolase (decyclizing) [Aquiluna borgnonia]|uniref:3D-(3,5/4)-trihydroxycyclohexane-1,2-dione acylhydrolase (Decyclizing) n=1 Tax=Aquiluna borgnonia TaxID=2499157 RepID=A0A7D4Q5H6_9MICO|nr:3D-(3,5/4)-trihydroxycyclohexane-1,2-dione acylhydrolase (decyclizing) [Aquiluna borgnonia]QKJ25683.1 3D-(3,5/4)-trihydroxycyclohexane-1,2-dione acylhydrolase (decyclizing) [Aquiluna borgnonia]
MATRRMTVSQALIEFLANQWTVDAGTRVRTIAGTFGIFGHGNVAGVGQALKQFSVDAPEMMPYYQARNEQAMVHESVAYARMNRRLSTFACAASVGPGASNMLTGAALATINRLPVLLLPSDTFANRAPDPVLQQLEAFHDGSISVNDAFKPLSKYFDRVQRPEQLFSACLNAMRVLTDPVETGAVTIALPEDVQAEILDVPEEFLAPREWHIRRPRPEARDIAAAARAIRTASNPMIIAGGGVIYSNAHDSLKAFVEKTGIPIGVAQAGMGSLPWDHPQNLGAVGATGTSAANRAAAKADVIIGIGTRYSDFTTASRTAFQNPAVKFVNINVAAFDAYKHGSAIPIVADAHAALLELIDAVGDFRVNDHYRSEYTGNKAHWEALVDESFVDKKLAEPSQAEIIGAVQQTSDPRDVVICAAGSLPGDLHKLWRVRDSLGYHVEYGYSCMGYEIAGGLGVARADKSRDAIVMVGDGSYLMMHTEMVSAVAEGIKFIIVLIQNHGYASIGHLSEDLGSQRFGTLYRFRNDEANNFETGDKLPVDLAANAESLGVNVIRVEPTTNAILDLKNALKEAKASKTATLIHIHSNPLLYAPDGEGWWDVPVAAVSTLDSTIRARESYEKALANQKPLLGKGAVERA